MDPYQQIPELRALRLAQNFIRIPPGVDVRLPPESVSSSIRSLFDGLQTLANWAWWEWSIRELNIRGSSILWAYIEMRFCSWND